MIGTPPQAPPGSQQSGSLSTLITVLQNLVQAVNLLTSTILNIEGHSTQENILIPTVITGATRLCRVSIVTEGTDVGFIYDSANLNDVFTPIWTIPTALGMVDVNLQVNNGIVVVPGPGGQNVTVSYS